MRYLCVTPETAGMWQFKLKPDDPAQPHMVRMAMMTISTDGDTSPLVDLIWPDPDWTFEPGAIQVHGITREIAADRGRLIRPVMEDYAAKLAECDALVLFSADFWLKVLRRSFRDAGMEWIEPPRVMDALKEMKALVHANAPKTFPDCYRYCTGNELRIPSDPILAGAVKVDALASIWQGVLARR
ncbi:MAG TPA: hypothetical protein VL614_14785 [Acetobacteraceae bacterium]|jgi:DNA polymerase III epsilon subunit-like protein|nr:hypothetical protein [Acetobacteraceae bacterium]